jgi:hypothetical protein
VWKYGGSRERERRGLQMTSLGFWRDGVIIYLRLSTLLHCADARSDWHGSLRVCSTLLMVLGAGNVSPLTVCKHGQGHFAVACYVTARRTVHEVPHHPFLCCLVGVRLVQTLPFCNRQTLSAGGAISGRNRNCGDS